MGQQIESALRQSIHRVLVVLVSFLPGVLAFLLALIVFIALGFLLAWLLRRSLTALRFDERLSSRQTSGGPSNVADWSPSQSPTLLVSRVALWACILIGIAVGISAFDASYAESSQFSQLLLPYFTHVTGAILLLLAGTILARFLSRSILISAVNAQMQYARFLALGVKWLVLVLTAAMALDHLGIGGAVVELAFGILFGGIVLTLSLAIGLGSRDLVSRSIEKTIDRPNLRPTDISSPATEEAPPRPKLRHF
jgi:hypothetical protein